ncbi:DUF6232 family protein [Actinomadura sp. NEAU-AAG7]|uniref:DUF6232 family protein n=1 Tax=Actinomadura sp. NEAU-AAG7 TaxID=2839640 RepID=UPI001BE432D6|nr:DUF6232 family protein [Actinomadura sp. NEAU-AAG7]MBT2208574.1 hypothetical protein [Actinomadura sp. NEAU-AAG7]
MHRHTLSIGPDYQVYQLRNVARVQVLDWKPDLGYGSISSVLWKMILAVIAVVVAGVAANTATSDAGWVNWAGLAAAVLAVRYLYQAIRIALRRTQWALVLETTGIPIAVITGKQREPVVELHRFIVNSIENPPAHVQTWHIGHLNMVGGDQINQSGEGNKWGKVLNG